MTCVVGLVDGGNVYIGADSAAVSGWEVRASGTSKVFQNGRFLIGYTSSFRMGQILQHHLRVEEQESGSDDMHYLVTVFVEAVRKCLKDLGWSEIQNNRETGGIFLVGYNGHLYCVYEDFQILCITDGLDAIGSGREYALGAMQALKQLPPGERIEKALEISAHFCGSVRSPFEVFTLEPASVNK